jgi:hypothetical protein
MYNFNKEESQNCLLFITLNYTPITINGNDYQIIQLDGEKGTANGQITIDTPNTMGLYEVIGYIIHDPFNKLSSSDNLVKSSYRFTLKMD